MKKRILSFLLALVMVLSVFPMTVFAEDVPTDAVAYVTTGEGEAAEPIQASDYGMTGEETPAVINPGYFKTLAAAIAACPGDKDNPETEPTTITMLKGDIFDGNAGWTIKNGQNIVLDLNGKTLGEIVKEAAWAQAFSIEYGATLTIDDTSAGQKGMVSNTLLDPEALVGEWWEYGINGEVLNDGYQNWSTNIITNRGTFILNGGTLKSNGQGSIAYGIDSHAGSKTVINGGLVYDDYGSAIRCAHGYSGHGNNIDFTMTGGQVGVKDKGASGIWMQTLTNDATGTYNISGGTIWASQAYAWYNDGYDAKNVKLNISGGTLHGTSQYGETAYGIYARGVSVNISGGTIISDDTRAVYGKNNSINISGGMINGGTYAVMSEGAIVDMSGGRVIAGTSPFYVFSGYNGKVNPITGGYFSSDVSSYLVDPYKCIPNKDTYDQVSADKGNDDILVDAEETGLKYKIGSGTPTQAEAEAKVTHNGVDTYCWTIADACAQAVSGDTVTVLVDKAVMGGSYISINGSKNLTIDLNNKEVINETTYGFDFDNGATAVIKNGTITGGKKALYIESGSQVTIENVEITSTASDCVYMWGGGELILADGSVNRITTTASNYPAIWGSYVYDTYNGISGNGTLYVDGDYSGIYAQTYTQSNQDYYGGIAVEAPNVYAKGTENGGLACYGYYYCSVTAGYYANDVSDYCAKDYVCVQNDNPSTKDVYPYTVKAEKDLTEDDYVAKATFKNGEIKYYTTLEKAIQNVKDDQTVTLLKDTILVGDGDYGTNKYDTKFTIDLNGKTVTNNSTYGFFFQKCDVTVKNGTVTGEGDAFYAYDGSTLTLNGVTAISTGDVAVVVEDATLNAADGSMNRIVSTADNTYGDGIEACGKATIGGTGTIIAEGVQSAVHVYGYEDYLGDKCPAELTVTNPNLFATNSKTSGSNSNRALYLSIEKGSGTTVKAVLYAGVYENDVEAYCAEEYGIVKLVNGIDEDKNYKDYYQVAKRSLKLNQEEITESEGTYKLGDKELTVETKSGESGPIEARDVIEKINEMLDNDTVAKYMDTNIEKATNQSTSLIKEALKDEVKTVDEEGQYTQENATEIKNNISSAIDLKEKVYVDLSSVTVEKQNTETQALMVTESEYEVKPMVTVVVTDADGESVTVKAVIPNKAIKAPISFLIPIDDSVTAPKIEMFHRKELTDTKQSVGVYPVITDENGKHVELAATEFSYYSYIMMDVSESAVAVIKTVDAAGNISYVGYDTLQAAVTAYTAEEGKTKNIILLKDANENVNFDSKTIELDLNGYVFKGASTAATGVTVKNTVKPGESITTLAATGVYANNVKDYVMDGYDTRTNTETATPAIVAGTTYNEVFNNLDPSNFTIEVITSTDTDHDSSNDETEIHTGNRVDVYADEYVTVQVKVNGARFTAADVTLIWDTSLFTDDTATWALPAGWNAIEDNDHNTIGWRFTSPKDNDDYYPEGTVLGTFTFKANYINESKINGTDNLCTFTVVNEDHPAKVIGGWGVTLADDKTDPVPTENLKDDTALILLMNSMTGAVEGRTGLIYKGSELDQKLLNDKYNGNKGWSAKVGGQEYAGATIEYCVLTEEEANGVQAKDASGNLLYVDPANAGQTTKEATHKVYYTDAGKTTPSEVATEYFDTVDNAPAYETGKAPVTPGSEGHAYSTKLPEGKDAGTYKVYYRIKADGYQTVENSVDVTIAKQKVNLEWTAPTGFTGSGASFTGEYDAGGFNKPTAKFSNLDGGTTPLTDADIEWTAGPNEDKSLKDVGEYTFTAKENKNYEFNNPTCAVKVTGKKIEGWMLEATGSGTIKDKDGNVDKTQGVIWRDGNSYPIGELKIDAAASVVKEGEVYKDKDGHEVTNVKCVYEYSTDSGRTWTPVPNNKPEDWKYSDLGKYNLRLTVTADNYEKLILDATFQIKNPLFKVENMEYVAGYEIVLVYTNEDGVAFKYGDQMMYDVSMFGYKYNNNNYYNGSEISAHVFAYLIKGAVDTSKVYASNDATLTLDLPNDYDSSNPEFVNDVNNTAAVGNKVELDDITFVQSIYNVNAINIQDIQRALRCDVDRDKKVDTIGDVSQVNAYYLEITSTH